MPTSALRPCTAPGCPRLVARGRCGLHAKRPWSHLEPSRHARGYGRTWSYLRTQVLREQPWCAACAWKRSTTVDHIKPKAQGGTDARFNLRALCKGCQQRKAGREGAQGRNRRA